MSNYRHKRTGSLYILDNTGYWYINGCNNTAKIPKDVVENSNDWELIEEPKKDYEILSVSDKDGTVCSNDYVFLESLVKNQEWKIHSVKRLSDGVVFTVGDTVVNKGYEKSWVNVSIKRILFQNGKMGIVTNGDGTYWDGILCNFDHAKKPLFTTVDDKEVFIGERVYAVRLNSGFTIWEPVLTNIEHDWDGYKVFSTKEAAGEYILMNKPVLTLKELYDHTTRSGLDLNELRRLVKSKLEK
jgi:hypothetical protein